MDLPYTMTPAEASTAALNIRPDILYIYHYGTSDTALIRALLKDYIDEIRIGPSFYFESDEKQSTPNPEVFQQPDIVVYPNPVKDFLIISNLNPGTDISLYDITGKLVIKQQMTGSGDQRLDLKALDPGAYLLKLQDKEILNSSLIVKE